MTQLYDDALDQTGLRVTQFALLNTLQRTGVMTISSLAQAMLLDRTALSRNLDPLVARGLVSIAAGVDARTRRVELTAVGKRALHGAEARWTAVQRELERRIGAGRLADLHRLLEDVEALHPARNDTVQPRKSA